FLSFDEPAAGIRDFHVTGVEACALPFSTPSSGTVRKNPGRFGARGETREKHSAGLPPAGGGTSTSLAKTLRSSCTARARRPLPDTIYVKGGDSQWTSSTGSTGRRSS